MKIFLCLLFLLAACRTTKVNSNGETVLTNNTKKMLKVHPNGFWAGGHWVKPVILDTMKTRNNFVNKNLHQ